MVQGELAPEKIPSRPNLMMHKNLSTIHVIRKTQIILAKPNYETAYRNVNRAKIKRFIRLMGKSFILKSSRLFLSIIFVRLNPKCLMQLSIY